MNERHYMLSESDREVLATMLVEWQVFKHALSGLGLGAMFATIILFLIVVLR